MSYVKIILHCVWSTKDRYPYLASKPNRFALHRHIGENAKAKGIYLLKIGGVADHIHILLSLSKSQEVGKSLQLLKGESSHWYNKQGMGILEWQDDYFAVSVSEDRMETIANYIANQEEHHRHKSFAEEYDEFMKVYGFNNKLG